MLDIGQIAAQRSGSTSDVSSVLHEAERDIPFAMEGIVYFHNPAVLSIRHMIKNLTKLISGKPRSECSRLEN